MNPESFARFRLNCRRGLVWGLRAVGYGFLAGVAVLLLALALPGPWLGSLASWGARRFAGVPLRISSVDLKVGGGLEVLALKLEPWDLGPLNLGASVESVVLDIGILSSLAKRTVVLHELKISKPSLKVHWARTPAPAGSGGESGPPSIPRFPLEVLSLALTEAALEFASPWAGASVWGLGAEGRGLSASSLTWEALGARWGGFRIDYPGAAEVLGEAGAASLDRSEDRRNFFLKADLPFELRARMDGLKRIAGRVRAKMTLPGADSILAGNLGFGGDMGLVLGGAEVLRVAAGGDSRAGELRLERLDLPLGRFLDMAMLRGLRLASPPAKFSWKDGDMKTAFSIHVGGLPKLSGAAEAPPELALSLRAKGRAGLGKLDLGADGKIEMGKALRAGLRATLSAGPSLGALAGLESGILDLKAVGKFLPLPAALSLDGLANLEGPSASWRDGRLSLAARLDSRGLRAVWAPSDGEAVTVTQEGFSAVLDAALRTGSSPEIRGDIQIGQLRQVLEGAWGRLVVPKPEGTLSFSAPLGIHPRLDLVLDMRHAGLEAPVALVRQFSLRGEAGFTATGLHARASGKLPDLGGNLSAGWDGDEGWLEIHAWPPPKSLRPYLDRIQGGLGARADFRWSAGQAPTMMSAGLRLDGLRVSRNEFDSGTLHGRIPWLPEKGSPAPVDSRLDPWTRDLFGGGERGSPVTIARFVYGEIAGTLRALASLRGWSVQLPEISGELLSGTLRASGVVRFQFPEGFLYGLELAASGIRPRNSASGTGISLNGRLEGANRDSPDGQFNVTRISGKDLSALLLKMDPDGKNQAIVNGRKKLALGFVPQNTSFTMRHGQAVLEATLKPGDFKSSLTFSVLPIRVEMPLKQTISVFLVSEEEPPSGGAT